MLALHVNAPVSVDHLIEGLWGEQAPRNAAKMVQLYVSQLRKLLAGGEAEILTRGRRYELRLSEESVDAARYERLITAVSREDPAPHRAAHEALSPWRGAPLDDLADEPVAAPEIRRLEELWLRARELAIDDALAADEHAAVVGELHGAIGWSGWHEPSADPRHRRAPHVPRLERHRPGGGKAGHPARSRGDPSQIPSPSRLA